VQLRALLGDITEADVDVVVNAANPGLLGGGGVDGAIHRAGGPDILAECRALKQRLPGGRLPRGEAVATTAGRLPARWVVHTAGPIWSASEDRSAVLRACYANSLRVADGLGARTVAFPAVSAGVYGWPLDDAARQAVSGVRSVEGEHVVEVRFVLFSPDALTAFQAVLAGGAATG
jgi:O-acetyl-ADP-ribose deacetylase